MVTRDGRVPTELTRLICRCLEKDPERRIQTAREVAGELRKISPADVSARSESGDRPAIAVLPFDNLSRDPDQEYFADGLVEDLIMRLSLWRLFPVIARNSSADAGGTRQGGPRHPSL